MQTFTTVDGGITTILFSVVSKWIRVDSCEDGGRRSSWFTKQLENSHTFAPRDPAMTQLSLNVFWGRSIRSCPCPCRLLLYHSLVNTLPFSSTYSTFSHPPNTLRLTNHGHHIRNHRHRLDHRGLHQSSLQERPMATPRCLLAQARTG
jgi:hypothetical protein